MLAWLERVVGLQAFGAFVILYRAVNIWKRIMTLTVETGTGSASSDAYISVADADTYHAAKGNATWTGTDADKETAIRRATSVLDGYNWQGLRTNGRSQALAWPRSGVIDKEGYGIDSDEIPSEIVDACAELALRELVTPGTMTPDVIPGEAIKSLSAGSVSIEYANPSNTASEARPIVSVVGPLIEQFLVSRGSSNALAGASYRV